jgi:hypothetical protein
MTATNQPEDTLEEIFKALEKSPQRTVTGFNFTIHTSDITTAIVAINTLIEEKVREATDMARAKLAKSVLMNSSLPPHTKEYLQGIVDARLVAPIDPKANSGEES